MSRDHWDAILASAPLNTTAGRVVSSGVHFEPREGKFTSYEWDAPPPMRSAGQIAVLLKKSPDFSDFTGVKYGRLAVLGIAAIGIDKTPAKGALWVCRCACGRYVGRRAKQIKAANPRAKCDGCNYTEHLRNAAEGVRARERAEAPEAKKW